MKKCVFFDRDGIVNEAPISRWVECWEDFHLLPEFVNILRYITNEGYESVIVTNQRSVAVGVVSQKTVDDIHARLKDDLKNLYDLNLTGIYTCPHDRDDGCKCRKPKPGMLFDAASDLDIDLKESWLIGDHETDVDAGIAAGCKTILVSSSVVDTKATCHVSDMKELESMIARIL